MFDIFINSSLTIGVLQKTSSDKFIFFRLIQLVIAKIACVTVLIKMVFCILQMFINNNKL